MMIEIPNQYPILNKSISTNWKRFFFFLFHFPLMVHCFFINALINNGLWVQYYFTEDYRRKIERTRFSFLWCQWLQRNALRLVTVPNCLAFVSVLRYSLMLEIQKLVDCYNMDDDIKMSLQIWQFGELG